MTVGSGRAKPLGHALFREDGPTIGVGVTELWGPSLAGVLADGGVDFALFDMEHTSLSLRDLAAFVVTAHAVALPVVVRPADVAAATIGRVLDLGADGILAQNIRSAADAAAVVRCAKYPPLGARGDDGRISSAGSAARASIDELNSNTVVMVIIETREAVDEIDAICATPGLDVVWVGPSDLSLALGVPADFESEAYRVCEERVLESCRAHGLPFAIGAAETPAAAAEHFRRGCFMVFMADELSVLRRGVSDYVTAVRVLPGSPGG